jgi:hypothetical protein
MNNIYNSIADCLKNNNIQELQNYIDICIENDISYKGIINTYNLSFLMIAARDKSNIETFKCLLKNGCNINIKNKYNSTLLHNMPNISIKYFKFFIDYGLMIDNSIFYIIKNIDTIKYIISLGYDINIINKYNQTPLFNAVGDYNLCKFMLENGINPNTKDINGKTILDTSYNITIKQIKLYIKHGLIINNNSIYHYLNNFETIKYFISKGININQINEKEETPLHIFCLKNNIFKNRNVFNFLLENTDINKRDINGRTIIFNLIITNQLTLNILKKLLDKKIDLNITDNIGDSILHYLFENGKLKLLNYLILNKMDSLINPLIINNNNETILHNLCKSDILNINLIKKIISYGVNPLIINNDGESILHLACSNYNITIDIIELLLSYGLNPNKCNNNKENIFYYLFENNPCDMNIFEYILQYINIDLINNHDIIVNYINKSIIFRRNYLMLETLDISDYIDKIKRQQYINNFKYKYFIFKFKKNFIKWLYKIREQRIIEKYSPLNLIKLLHNNIDDNMDIILDTW